MNCYKVTFYYKESQPENKDRIYHIEYTIDSDNERQAYQIARKKFESYYGNTSASWIRQIISTNVEQIQVMASEHQIVDQIHEKLHSLNKYHKLEAVSAIAAIRDDHFTRDLFEEYESADEFLKQKIIQALEKFNTEYVLQFLHRKAESETSDNVLATVIAALGRMRNPGSVAVIIPFLKHDETRVVANAIEALQYIGATESVEYIEPFMKSGNNRIKANAAKALYHLAGDEKCHRILSEMAASDNHNERSSAAFVFGELNDISFTNELIRMLADPEPAVRENVLDSLSLKDDPRIKGIIREYLETEKEPFLIQKALHIIEEY